MAALQSWNHGTVHLHAHGVIHGDVKPANILVNALERGLLADFDISIDTKSRTSAAHVTRKSKQTCSSTITGPLLVQRDQRRLSQCVKQ